MRLILAVCLAIPVLASAQTRAHNVILFLADAAGLPTINAASIHGYGAPRKLFIQRMPQIALSETSTASEFVTDSAAGMTAIVTGTRTHNGVIAQAADAVRGRRDGAPLKTILEYAEERGLATGVISNDAIAGATPGALYAHVNDRDREAEIFMQAFTPRFGDGVDVLIGSGRADMLKMLGAAGQSLGALEQRHGRKVLSSFAEVDAGASRAIVLLDDEAFDVGAATRLAIEMLSRHPNGYFLMVESDAHTDSIRQGLDRVVSFDRAIQEVSTRVGEDTLLLFTADHSFDFRVFAGTWGTPLLEGVPAEKGDGAQTVRLRSVRMDDDHTGEEVLVAAQGPGSERVRGYMANTDLFQVMMSAFGWETGPATR
jgi:alkaline phosphatase